MVTEYLTSEEIVKILSIPDRRSRQGLRDYLVLRILVEVGLGKGELCLLNEDSIFMRNNQPWIKIESLKKRKKKGKDGFKEKTHYREIPLKQDLYEYLNKYLHSLNKEEHMSSKPLLQTLGKHGPYNSERITPAAIDIIVRKYCNLAKIEKRVSPHIFRHSFATNLLRSGVDLATVKELLGHEHVMSTQIYLHTSESNKIDAISKIF